MGGSFIGTMPCQGDQLYEIWAPANEVFHVTAAGQRPNGDYIPPFRIHYSAIGRVLAVPSRAAVRPSGAITRTVRSRSS
jgi:hypothetical protein